MDGTSFIVGNENGVYPMLVDQNGYGLMVTGTSATAIKGFQIGCLLVDTTIGKLYINTGTTTTATWTVVGSQS